MTQGTYRDDRDALHARNQALEAEVEALRAQQEQAARAHELELEAALQGHRPERPASQRQRVHPGAALALVAASAVAFSTVMAMRHRGACGASYHHGRNAPAAWTAPTRGVEGAHRSVPTLAPHRESSSGIVIAPAAPNR